MFWLGRSFKDSSRERNLKRQQAERKHTSLEDTLIRSLREDPTWRKEGTNTLKHIASWYSIWIWNWYNHFEQYLPVKHKFWKRKRELWDVYMEWKWIIWQAHLMKWVSYKEYLEEDMKIKKKIADRLYNEINIIQDTIKRIKEIIENILVFNNITM